MIAFFFVLSAACGSDRVEPPSDVPGADSGVSPDSGGPDAGLPCSIAPGVYVDQPLSFEGEDRFFELVVPSTLACDRAYPLLVDFHGAYGGERPEEAYRNRELLALADRREVVFARARSRRSVVDGRNWYYWDNPPGDLELNQRFAAALVDHLASMLPIDRSRVYASGYSSGGNMALSLVTVPDAPFAGVGAVGAGYWGGAEGGRSIGEGVRVRIPVPPGDPPRIYIAPGYRDLLSPSGFATRDALLEGPFDPDRLFFRELDDGHSILAWQYDEMLTFFETGARPAPRVAAGAWREEEAPSASSLLEIAVSPAGMVVGTADGRVYRRTAAAWEAIVETSLPVIALCAHDRGGYAATHTRLFAWETGSASEVEVPIAPGTLALRIALACSADGAVVLGGPPVMMRAAGASEFTTLPDAGVETNGLALLDGGVVIASGRHGTVERIDGGLALPREPITDGPFFHAIAASGAHVWIAGEAGLVLHSSDGGRTFTTQATPLADDLYAIAFRDDRVGVAVGAHGAAILTRNGGETWEDVSAGTDRMLAGVAFDGASVVAVGEAGAFLRLAL